MELFERFKSGVSTASDSFYILWKHKSMLSYFGFVALIKMLLTFLSLNTCYALHIYSSVLSFIFINIPAQFGLVLITTIAQIALTHHAAHIFKGQEASLLKSVTASLHKWQLILMWSGITFCVTHFLGQLSQLRHAQLFETSFGILGLSWALLTLFVPTSIALEDLSLLEHLKHAVIVIRNYLFKLLGGLLWIGIIFLLCMAPFGGARLIAQCTSSLYYNMLFLQVTNSLELAVQCGIISAYILFKAMLYLQYKKGIEELQQLKYPRM